jgi:uncharacterized membrane protein
MIDPKQLAESVLQLLQADPRRYRLFGVYWYFIKALMKRYYTKDNLYLLGDYVDPTVNARLPQQPLEETLDAAIAEYRHNFAYSLGKNPTDPDGEEFVLFDPDADL